MYKLQLIVYRIFSAAIALAISTALYAVVENVCVSLFCFVKDFPVRLGCSCCRQLSRVARQQVMCWCFSSFVLVTFPS